MKKSVICFVTVGLVAIGTICVSTCPMLVAQESGKTASKAEKGGDAKGAKKPASGDRLPANYGKIGVNEEQRKKIYEIQNKYDDQVAALQRQITELKAKETAEVEAVLTPEQKKALQAAIEESKKKAADKKKASEPKAEESKKADK